MITQELKELVVQEALKLREHATDKEKAMLDYKTLDPNRIKKCIYGQIAKGCHSKRAIELLGLCAIAYSHYPNLYIPASLGDDFTGEECRSFSAIEYYICQEDAKIKDIIGLIKS